MTTAEPTTADLALVDGHAELAGLRRQLATEQSFLDGYDKIKDALIERAKSERAQQWEARRQSGAKGRRPLLPAEVELGGLEEKRAASELAVESLPTVIERASARLAEDLLLVRAAQPDVFKLAEDLATARETAEKLLSLYDGCESLRARIERVQNAVVRSWAVDLSNLRLDILPGLGGVAERLRPFLAATAAAGAEDPERAALDRRRADEQRYQRELAVATRRFKTTPAGKRDFAAMSRIAAIVAEAHTHLQGPALSETVSRAQAGYDLFHRSACQFAGIAIREDLFPRVP